MGYGDNIHASERLARHDARNMAVIREARELQGWPGIALSEEALWAHF
jgi:hypothetical protein